MINNIKLTLRKIQNNLLPALSNKLGININTSPVYIKQTSARFSGEDTENRIILEFYSSHVDIESKDELFVYVYYGSGGTKGGIININDIEGSVNVIYEDLYELGFRTKEDLENEKQEEPEIEKKEVVPVKDKEIEPEETSVEEPEQEEEPVESATKEDFDLYLKALKRENKPNSTLSASILIQSTEIQYKMLTIDMIYATPNICLVQTTGINPKVDKTASWEAAKNYVFKVTEKVNGTLSFIAYDEEGKEIEVYKDTDEDNLDVGIEI